MQVAEGNSYGPVETRLDATIDELRRTLDQGRPALVALQAWPDRPVDYREDWEDGHRALAIGYDEGNVSIRDPSTLGNDTCVPLGEILDRWHDADTYNETHLNHLMLVIAKPRPACDPGAALRLE